MFLNRAKRIYANNISTTYKRQKNALNTKKEAVCIEIKTKEFGKGRFVDIVV
jgi:hypothetical protein